MGQIEDLQIYCRYGVMEENGQLVPDPSGCQQKIHLGSVKIRKIGTPEKMTVSVLNFEQNGFIVE